MNRLKTFIVSTLLLASVVAPLAIAPVSAVTADPFKAACTANSSSTICRGSNESASSIVNPIVSTLLFLIGAVAVVVIIIGGVMFVTSTGDPGKTKKARDTILYAVVGLVVALLAYAIVRFVVLRF